MTVAERIGRNVRRIRREQDLSQEALADRAAIHRTQMTLYETGQRLPKPSTLIKLAGALGVDVNTLCVGIRWVPGGSRPGHFEIKEGR